MPARRGGVSGRPRADGSDTRQIPLSSLMMSVPVEKLATLPTIVGLSFAWKHGGVDPCTCLKRVSALVEM